MGKIIVVLSTELMGIKGNIGLIIIPIFISDIKGPFYTFYFIVLNN